MESVPFPLVQDAVGAPADRLSLDAAAFRRLFEAFGPSLGLWRSAEIAALRTCTYARPVVDLGCGDGTVTSMVLDQVDVGLDPWPLALERASALGLYRAVERASIEQTTLPPASARTIISNSVLEHVADVHAVLAASARLLVPGGRLIFTVPTEALGSWLLLPSGRYSAWRNAGYEHRNLWPVDLWARRLEAAGLEVESVRPYLRRPLVALWDALDLAQRVWVGRWRLAGVIRKHLPGPVLAMLARIASRLDLSAQPPGGGRLIIARRESK